MSLLLVRSTSRRSSALRRGFASLIQPRDQTVAVEQDTRREIECVTERLRSDIAKNDQPVLMKAAEYFFQKGREGKRFRSTVVLLMSTALSAHGPLQSQLEVDSSPAAQHPEDLRRRQQRIAEIAELIHVASLLHDDVIDDSDSRRGLKALNTLLGNKVAILAGDFLLARASVSLASLHDHRVIALMSQILEDLVSGEILQMTSGHDEATSVETYMTKTFYKTASLIANSCKSVALLARCSNEEAEAAWGYGKNLGIAFQLVDDVLDFTSSQEELGKPVGSDVRSGLATYPVLAASEEHPELLPMIRRRFRGPEDIDRALELVKNSHGIEKAIDLAAYHADEAVRALERLPPALGPDADASRAALEAITRKVTLERLR